MITNAGIEIIDFLYGGREATVETLADKTGHSKSHVYRLADKLRDTGLLAESREHHNQRVLSVTDHPVIETYRTLTSKLGHVDWPTLLSPATIRVCWFLNEPRRTKTIAERLEITRQAVHHALTPLKNRAMLAPSGPEYALASDMRPLLDFVRAVITHEHRVRVRRHAPTATVEWCDPERALVQVHDSDETDSLRSADEWEITGLARFEDFGLQFFLAGEPAFWYKSGEPLTPAQIVCHSLVNESGSRRVSYALLLVEHRRIAKERLLDVAIWYDLESVVSEMYRFLEDDFEPSNGSESSLPNPTEYEALKSQYGVV